MTAATALPSTVRDLALDLTSLAQTVVMAASLPGSPPLDDDGGLRPTTVLRDSYVEAWESLTGLTGAEALEAARAITRHPLPVTAVVVPF